MKIVVIGGGAAGLGVAGAAKGQDPSVQTVVYTEYEDVAYSPCGIPFVHGKEIESFEKLFLATKEQYVAQGIDVHYETSVESIDPRSRTIKVSGEGEVSYDKLVLATGWNYDTPDSPGVELGGIYHVKNIRAAMEWDRYLDTVKSAVVVESGPIAMEMVSALRHRGIDVTLIDPGPWPMADVIDPDIVEPVRKDWEESGVTLKFGERVTAFRGTDTLTHVSTTFGDVPAQLAVIGSHKVANSGLAGSAGIKLGSTGGIAVDPRMRTSDPNVYAAGDCAEIPHGRAKADVVGPAPRGSGACDPELARRLLIEIG